MKKLRISALAALALFVSGLVLSACNTMEGAGQDISAAGKGLEKSADKNKGY